MAVARLELLPLAQLSTQHVIHLSEGREPLAWRAVEHNLERRMGTTALHGLAIHQLVDIAEMDDPLAIILWA